jgi:NTE family protein
MGMPLPEDPPIVWNYDHDAGGALPPRPNLRPGSPRLLWDGIRRPTSVSPFVALSGLLPRGRGTLGPIHHMLDTVVEQKLSGRGWPAQPTWIVATDYSTGQRVVFGRDGDPVAGLADAVCASCAIPAWYAPVQIAGAAYIDGGTRSNTSVDLLADRELDEVFVLAPMAAITPDSPRSPVAMVERRVRRVITRGVLADVNRLRANGVRVHLLTPVAEDLESMGANLMNPRRRAAVLHTAMRTTVVQLQAQRQAEAAIAEAGAG